MVDEAAGGRAAHDDILNRDPMRAALELEDLRRSRSLDIAEKNRFERGWNEAHQAALSRAATRRPGRRR